MKSCLLALLLPLTACLAQPKSELKQPPPLDPVEGRKQARALVENLLSLKPTENLSGKLLLKITDAEDKETQVPAQFQVVLTPTNFLSIYETLSQGASGMKLTIIHTEGQPNQYLLNRPAGGPSKALSTNELMLPFAGSDFWVADLGLEFLHWPEQRIIRKEMRLSVFCDRLESINPKPVPGGYAKVVSWIGANRPGELIIVHADAYDSKGKLLKQFEPKKLERVNGINQLKEMEIRNRQAGTHTRIEFELRK
jgi:hypothetical protein